MFAAIRVEMMKKVGIPDGAAQVLTGLGSTTGAASSIIWGFCRKPVPRIEG